MALAEQGRLDEAEQLLASAGMLGPISTERPPDRRRSAAAGACGSLRATPPARSRISPPRAIAARRCSDERVEPPWQPLLAEALVLADRGDEAAAEAEAYAPLAAGWGTRRALGHAARMRALVAPRERRSRCSRRPERISRPATRGSSWRAA